MSRVITFSTTFPSYHPRKGEPTRFIEKIYASLADTVEGFKIPNDANEYWDWHEYYNCRHPKHHTVRAGHRFKVGDWFSPRIWSGIPYRSPQIVIGPDIQIKNIWDFEIKKAWKELPLDYDTDIIINHMFYHSDDEIITLLAKNDGLTLPELLQWFKYPKPFDGQIICWGQNINYS